jgi:SAM-dependent methyltransferase
MSTTTTPTGTSAVQGKLWGSRAADWANLQEPGSAPLYRKLIEIAGIRSGTRVLDVGCASGYFDRLAADAGADVTGFDASEQLLEIARTRLPEGEFIQGEIESLPFADGSFDVVSGFNSFQYAGSPVDALREAKRVSRGIVSAAVWGQADHCDLAAYLAALGSCLPPPPPGAPGPFALSDPGALEGLLAQAGLEVEHAEEVMCVWDYPDIDTAVRGLSSAGPAVRAIEHSGEETVTKAIVASLEPYRRNDGGYYVENGFLLVVSR